MTLTKTTEYALRTLTLMSRQPSAQYSSERLHRELKIPRKYLQRLLTDLSKNGLIRSTRGRSGGYAFARPIESISVSEVIDAVEGFRETSSCFFGFDHCPMDNPCAMHDVWTRSHEHMVQVLSRTRLVDLVKGGR